MQIHQVSNALDAKLAQLDKKLKQLEQTNSQAPDAQLDRDIQALHQVRDKLLKSRELAWKAHALQYQDTDENRRKRQRLIGLSLCAISLMGALALIVFAIRQ